MSSLRLISTCHFVVLSGSQLLKSIKLEIDDNLLSLLINMLLTIAQLPKSLTVKFNNNSHVSKPEIIPCLYPFSDNHESIKFGSSQLISKLFISIVLFFLMLSYSRYFSINFLRVSLLAIYLTHYSFFLGNLLYIICTFNNFSSF